ncbi:MAG: alpha-galactosidase [Candidatus Omnitrophica bacterium]|nr:alpha-galactosidase [Candidatus Omnitrophota bacterium]
MTCDVFKRDGRPRRDRFSTGKSGASNAWYSRGLALAGARGWAGLFVVLCVLLVVPAQAVTQLNRDGKVLRLSNGLIATTFNLASGEWEALYNDGTVFATQLRCTLDTDGTISTTNGPPTFTFFLIRQPIDRGIRLEIQRGTVRPMVLALTMYDNLPLLFVQVRLPDAKGIKISQVTVPEGRIYAGEDVHKVCVLANPTAGTGYSEIEPIDLTDARNHWETDSRFYLCAYNRADERSVVLGALYAKGSNHIEAEVDPQRDGRAIFFKSCCSYESTPLSVETETWESPVFVMGAPTNVFQGLEAYGTAARAYRPHPILDRPPSGWCSRDTGASTNQDELFANIDALKANHLDEFGLRYVQLDDGWQEGSHSSGQWWPRPDRFPEGMKGVADYIQSKGFVPGLWFSPFGEDAGQSNQKGLFAIGMSGGYDLSRQNFKQFLRETVNRLVNDWGFRYLEVGSFPLDQPLGLTAPYEVSYREAVRTMLGILAPCKGYLLSSHGYEWLSAGLSDGQCLGGEVRGGDLTGLYPTLESWPRRYFGHNNFWIGDPGLLHIDLPTDAQSRVWASFVALSGGAAFSGDDITKLPPSRIQILKKAFPAQGIAARPCDLFDRPPGWAPKFPRIWDCKIRQGGVGQWDVVGLFNWTLDSGAGPGGNVGEPQNAIVKFGKHLDLKPDRRYLVYDFWRQQYLGAFTNELRVGLPPASCRVLVIREETDAPQFLGDNRHIVNGAGALERIQWDKGFQTLSGWVETASHFRYSMALHLPSGVTIARVKANGQAVTNVVIHDFWSEITFDSGNDGKVQWTVEMRSAPMPPEATANSTLGWLPTVQPAAGDKEIVLRRVQPLWTDRQHDAGSRPIVHGSSPDLETLAPFWIDWDVSAYTSTHPFLETDCAAAGDGKVFFEVLGDGVPIQATGVLQKDQTAHLKIPVAGLKELTIICHYVDGWFENVKGILKNPRLVPK